MKLPSKSKFNNIAPYHLGMFGNSLSTVHKSTDVPNISVPTSVVNIVGALPSSSRQNNSHDVSVVANSPEINMIKNKLIKHC